jgi:Holliday junction resolvase
MSSSAFERELKGILRGDRKVLEAATRSCDGMERDGYFRIADHPFMVSRAAGSLGVDLIAIRGDISFPIEVKTSKRKLFHFSNTERTKEQQSWLLEECERSNVLPLYAYRLKGVRGDSWRVFTTDRLKVNGRLRVLQNRVPKVDFSKNGNLILRWDDGMPLSAFLRYLSR